MKILVFNWQDRLHPQAGGAEAHLHEIFSRLVKRGHTVHLVTCGFDGAPSSTHIDGMTVYRIGTRTTFNLHVPFWWRRTGVKLGVDIVVDDINKIPLFTPLFVKAPIIAIVHHLFGSSIYKEASLPAALYVRLSERLLPHVYRSTQVAVVSESTRSECASIGMPESNMTVIHNGIDQHAYPMRVGQKTNYPTVTYFGRLKQYKSVDHLFEAFAILRRSQAKARLWIIGKGDDEKRLRSLASDLGIESSIVWHGFVSEKQKYELLSQSWVVVNPSIKEGWGITNIESNACGTPVISADSPGLRDSVSIDVSGKLYPYGDIRMLSHEIESLFNDLKRREALEQSSVVWAQRFSWDESTDAMEKLLLTKCDTP